MKPTLKQTNQEKVMLEVALNENGTSELVNLNALLSITW